MSTSDYSLNKRIRLTAFLVSFVEESIEETSKWKFMLKITEFFTDSLESLYKVNSALNLDNSDNRTNEEWKSEYSNPSSQKMSKFG